VTIRRKLLKGGPVPVFGATKTKKIRTLQLAPESIACLKAHKQAQATIKMQNRQHYHDHGLVFAKAYADGGRLGEPLQVNNLGSRQFARLMKAAGVPRITLHGLRHTCATLMIASGEPVNVVQQHLGHSKVEMTLNVYSHVLKAMEQGAADRRSAWLQALPG
jgi:integrase